MHWSAGAVCEAGDVQRPTTTRPVIVHHPSVDPSFLPLAGDDPEIHSLALPLLENVILVDCPDPDTQPATANSPRSGESDRRSSDTNAGDATDRHASPMSNLSALEDEHCRQPQPGNPAPRAAALRCADPRRHGEKYKTQAVTRELREHAPGRQIVFVQTHAATDADIRPDWRRHLESIGFDVPTLFRIDSEEALTAARARRTGAVPNSTSCWTFSAASWPSAAASGSSGPMSWILSIGLCKPSSSDVQAALPKVARAGAGRGGRAGTLVRQSSRAAGRAASREPASVASAAVAAGHRALERRTVRLVCAAGELGRLACAAVAAGACARTGAAWSSPAASARARRLSSNGASRFRPPTGSPPPTWASIRPTSPSRKRCWKGMARQAGLDGRGAGCRARAHARARRRRIAGRACAAASRPDRVYACRRDRERTRRRGGRLFHLLLEVLFCLLPAALAWRGWRTTFSMSTIGSPSPSRSGRSSRSTALEYLVQALLWVVVWGFLLRGWLVWRLHARA